MVLYRCKNTPSFASILLVYNLIRDDSIPELFLTEIILIIEIIFASFIFYSLRRRLLLGWRLNWILLIGETLMVPIDKTNSTDTYFMIMVLLGLVWFLPNYIYFKKRRYYFNKEWQWRNSGEL